MTKNFDFLTHFESVSGLERKEIIEWAKAQGGKFALLGRILEGDSQAVIELEEHIKAKRVMPDQDLTTREN